MTGKLERRARQFRAKNGFTLIELIVVITIIGILASAVVLNLAGRTDQAKVARVKADFHSILTVANMFKADHGYWPESIDELLNPPETADNTLFKYLDNQPNDPWTNELYFYELADDGPILTSWGADKTEGGDGMDKDLISDEM